LNEYPEWVEVGSTRELKDPSSLDEDLYIFTQDEKLYLAEIIFLPAPNPPDEVSCPGIFFVVNFPMIFLP